MNLLQSSISALKLSLKRMVFCGLMLISASGFAQGVVQNAKDLTCQGKFINPITDICWSCVLPIKIGGKYNLMEMGQEDYDSMKGDKKLFCACSNPTRVGVQLSFWEPTHLVETVRHPFCMVSLGGLNWGKKFDQTVSKNESLAKWFGGSHKNDKSSSTMGGGSTASFYQVHWYKNPLIYWLQVLLGDDYCLDKGALDIGWMTELDPTWKSPALAMLQAPDAALFANPIAQAVCAADCIKANLGFPSEKLFWCAGCHGSIYPYTGYISNQVSPVQAAKLMVARMQSKMHRDFVAHTATGKSGLCGFRFQPLMDKRQYKMSMTYPVPARKSSIETTTISAADAAIGSGTATAPKPYTEGTSVSPDMDSTTTFKKNADGSFTKTFSEVKGNGKCCEPIGRTTLVRDAGKSFPYKGQDFAYQVFRKRDCCAGR